LTRIDAAGYTPEQEADEIKAARAGVKIASAAGAAYVEAAKIGIKRLFRFG
jgi:hypothetical protein